MFHDISLLDTNVVLVRRSSLEFSDSAEVDRERERVRGILDGLGRAGKRLLIDSRQAPLSTDARMSDAFRKLREELARGFDRTAVVVASKLGVLQAGRLLADMRIDGSKGIFESEQAALQYLKQ
ncbi:MAG TPA: hypothetical protein VHM70_04630 [Polyangiaceae bacterium]|jgi:hypothetical protein|nr:hypothetical protein [Polyangiaceae bacterium]